MAVKWFGKKVSAKMRRAQIAGVNATMAAAVNRAKRKHAWQNRSGTLEGSIDIHDYAAAAARGVRGVWGSRDVRYARAQEEGAVIVPVRARALVFRTPGGNFVSVKKVTLPARPNLRPAANAEYKHLAGRIRRAYEGGA